MHEPRIKVFSNGENSKNKKFPAKCLSMKKKISRNRPLKNKTIPENVHWGTNNFHKSSVDEQIISQIIRHFYNKLVEMFKKN